MKKDIYCIGECKQCKRIKPLKNGKCSICQSIEIPDMFKDLFDFNKEDINGKS